jgi:hypothetical protein
VVIPSRCRGVSVLLSLNRSLPAPAESGCYRQLTTFHGHTARPELRMIVRPIARITPTTRDAAGRERDLAA